MRSSSCVGARCRDDRVFEYISSKSCCVIVEFFIISFSVKIYRMFSLRESITGHNIL